MTSTPNQNKFNFVFLGQSILKYEVPLDIFLTINKIYENKYSKLERANKQLVGKIEKEHSLFYDGKDSSKMIKHNHLSGDVIHWFQEKFKHYLQFNKVKEYNLHLNSIWVNTMFEHEYNPVHVHQGTLFTGLSSVMILRLPKSYGVEYSAPESPQNGKLQILGSTNGYFANVDYQPNTKERDFYIFPYDMRHCVYPFNGPGYRRTLAANMDVDYDPIKNRGVSDVS
tara:strand:+ start:387 stop:1064 length:678 start_codon:yes stop_codon:yes gene_type:complete